LKPSKSIVKFIRFYISPEKLPGAATGFVLNSIPTRKLYNPLSSTPLGGVQGTRGYHAAKAVLKKEFSDTIRI